MFLFSLLCTVLFLLYNGVLKRIVILKDLRVGFGFAIPLIYGALVHAEGISPMVIFFIFQSFLVGLAIEIFCDIRDIEGDAVSNVPTLPIKTSEHFSAHVAPALFAGCLAYVPGAMFQDQFIWFL